jgi:hypothetical protein
VRSRTLDVNYGSQKFAIEAISGTSYYRIKNPWSGRYLSAPNTTAGTTLQIQDLNTSWSSQQWEIILVSGSSYRIRNRWSGLYVTAGASSGTDVKQQALNSSSLAQLFQLPTY